MAKIRTIRNPAKLARQAARKGKAILATMWQRADDSAPPTPRKGKRGG